jgi:hypothetical protein
MCLFAGSVFLNALILIGAVLGIGGSFENADQVFEHADSGVKTFRIIGATAITAVFAAIHYYRFRVPITIAVGVAALVGAGASGLAAIAPDWVERHIAIVILIFGLAVFVLAMRFDLSDPARITRRTDIAFWLHMLAAPMIVHPMIVELLADSSTMTPATAASVLGIFLVLGIVAVIIDRRALLVSGLAYAGYASATIFKTAGLEGHTMPATLLALGAFILLLSAGWRPVRTGLLKLLPANLAQKLPHPILSGS